ncbi:hypothetical protein SCUP234_13340 [Seiridium cupressi]
MFGDLEAPAPLQGRSRGPKWHLEIGEPKEQPARGLGAEPDQRHTLVVAWDMSIKSRKASGFKPLASYNPGASCWDKVKITPSPHCWPKVMVGTPASIHTLNASKPDATWILTWPKENVVLGPTMRSDCLFDSATSMHTLAATIQNLRHPRRNPTPGDIVHALAAYATPQGIHSTRSLSR